MIYIGLGSNLSSVEFGSPNNIIALSIDRLLDCGVLVLGRSRYFRTQPVPASDQPWFVNAVVSVACDLPPAALLATLHGIEAAFGRVRRERWEARVLDLDLLAYHDLVQPGNAALGEPTLPHPRLHERAFVLRPLADLDPLWRHPATGVPLAELLRALPPDQVAEPVDG